MKGYLDQCMNEWISEWLLKWKRNYCRCLNWKYDVQWSQWSWCWSLSHFALSPLSLSPSSISSSFPNHDSHNSDSVFLFYNSFSQSPSQLSPPHFCPLTFAPSLLPTSYSSSSSFPLPSFAASTLDAGGRVSLLIKSVVADKNTKERKKHKKTNTNRRIRAKCWIYMQWEKVIWMKHLQRLFPMKTAA